MKDKNLKKWLGNSKLKDSEDNPLLLFHGTQSEFNIFDLKYTDEENYFGKGFYFTDNYNDAVINYEGFCYYFGR